MKNYLVQRAAIAAFALSLASVAQAGPNLVANGGFEDTTSGTGQIGANTTVTDWTTGLDGSGNFPYSFLYTPGTADTSGAPINGGGNAILWGPGSGVNNGLTVSPNGGNYVALDGDARYNAALSQTINGLTPGAACSVTFYWAGAELDSVALATTDQLQVAFGSQTQTTPVINDASQGFTNWQSQTLSFTADAPSEVLSFLALGTPQGGEPMVLLDGVSLSQTVPDNLSAGALLGLTTLALFCLPRLRKV